MTKEINNTEFTQEEINALEERILKLSKTYNFEGEEINTVDLSGLDNVSANQMIQAQKMITKSGNTTALL